MQPKGFTFHEWAQNQADLEQGRFAKVNETKIVGAGAAYPKQPEGSPFACDPVPQEPPLGEEKPSCTPHVDVEPSACDAAAQGAPVVFSPAGALSERRRA